MPSRSIDRGFYNPLSEMRRPCEHVFGGLMRPAESNKRVPIAVGA